MAAGAAAVLGVAMAGGVWAASCEAPAPGVAATGAESEASLAQLHEWLSSQGADVSKVRVQRSQIGPGAGLGLFATAPASSCRPGAPWWAWLWPFRGGPERRHPTTVASFPLAAAITAQTACEDPVLGTQFRWMLEKQMLDERTCVMVYLLVERLRGEQSRFAPWIRSLPTSFDVPIAFSEGELAALRGTALHGAASAVLGRMRDTWGRLERPLGAVARELGVRPPAWDDWVWAHCVFWSRGQSLPVPDSGPGSEALVQMSSNGGDRVHVQILEGLVPGLDFCNHRVSPAPQAWWEVVTARRPKAAGGSGSPVASTSSPAPGGLTPSFSASTVQLQLHHGSRVRPGEELFISYGDKSNEELFMLYGFALERNPHDRLMLHLPLPKKEEWDDVMYARMQLLQAYGLTPQFFLPHPDLVAPQGASPNRAKKCDKRKDVDVASPDAGAKAAVPPLVLPAAVLDTLEVFVLNFQELAVRSQALKAKMEERRAGHAAPGSSAPAEASQHSPVLDLASLRSRLGHMSAAELRHYLQTLGLRMATLTSFIRLLELKVVQLEGSEGSGPLEEDERLLSRMGAGATASSAAEQAGGKAVGAAAAAPAPAPAAAQQRERRLRSALVYRIGQKRLAREWLVRAKGELSNLLALMRDMQDRQGAVERGGAQAAGR